MAKCCRCFSFSEKLQQSFSGKNDAKPGWPLSVFTLTPSPALAEADQDPSAGHDEISEICGFGINSVHPLIPKELGCMYQAGSVPRFNRAGASVGQRPGLTFKGRDSHQDPSAKGGTGLQLLSHAHFMELRKASHLSLPHSH